MTASSADGEALSPSRREAELRAVTIGEPTVLSGPVTLVEYDPAWPGSFDTEARRIREAIGDRALGIEHVGSTAVPGLVAKPIIDIVLSVADSAAEADYLPALEAAGYVLRIREPAWHEHRMLKGPAVDINLHVFAGGCPEIQRLLAFRDRLRSNPPDREAYATTKRELAARHWTHLQDYADAKGAVIEAILKPAKQD